MTLSKIPSLYLKYSVETNLTVRRYKNKIIDLSQTFRQTGLPSGATLELVVASRSAGVVSVALQFPDGARSIDKFPSDTTLWRILRKFESAEGKNLNITGRSFAHVENGASGAGRIFYEMPSINVVGRECSTFGDLQKTLQQLGINNGTALMKLSYKRTEQPLEEAMTQIGDYFKEEAATSGPEGESSAATPVSEVSNVTEAVARLSSVEPASIEHKATEVTSQDTSERTTEGSTLRPETAEDSSSLVIPVKRPAPVSPETEPILEVNQRRIEVYLPPSSYTPLAARTPHNEEDFEPSISQLQSVQGRLQRNAQNKRLPSDAEMEREEEEKRAKLSGMKEMQIKIKFSDEYEATATLYSTDDSAMLYELVKSILEAEDQPFKLVRPDNRGKWITVPWDKRKKLAKDLGFSFRDKVNFYWEDGASESARKAPTLKHKFLHKAKELQVPEVVVSDNKENGNAKDVDKGKGKAPEGGGKSGVSRLQNLLKSKISKK